MHIYRKVLAVEIYSPYARKNLDLPDQGQRGIVYCNDDVFDQGPHGIVGYGHDDVSFVYGSK